MIVANSMGCDKK